MCEVFFFGRAEEQRRTLMGVAEEGFIENDKSREV
jgi:hypothetical protein